MILYLDIFYLNNLLMDMVMVLTAVELSRRKVNMIKIIIAANVGAIYSVIVVVTKCPNGIFSHILIGLIFSIIIWGIKKIKYLLKGFVYIFCSNFIISGILYLLKDKIQNQIINILAAIIVLVLCIKELITRNSYDNSLANVTLIHQEHKLKCIGIWDTGNSLLDPYTKKPVFIIEKSILKKIIFDLKNEKIRLVPFNSVGRTNGLLPVITINKIIIWDKKHTKEYENVLVAMTDNMISPNLPYDMIMNPLILESKEAE